MVLLFLIKWIRILFLPERMYDICINCDLYLSRLAALRGGMIWGIFHWTGEGAVLSRLLAPAPNTNLGADQLRPTFQNHGHDLIQCEFMSFTLPSNFNNYTRLTLIIINYNAVWCFCFVFSLFNTSSFF